jgi:hypothetical protein
MTTPVSGDLLSAASLLATIISLLYSIWYGEIKTARNIRIPLHYDENATKAVRGTLRYRAIPLLVSAILLALALGSPAADVLQGVWSAWMNSGDHSSYDPVQACFFGVFLITIMLFVLTLLPVCSLARLLRRLPKKP